MRPVETEASRCAESAHGSATMRRNTSRRIREGRVSIEMGPERVIEW
jgi:hypothetical protein